MTSVDIGIHLHTDPERLGATLRCLRAETTLPIRILLLPDGPDAATRTALERLGELPQSATAEPRGAAACFNRLLRWSSADVVIFLEAGALVGPGWLELLLAALQADPRNGLAGPSTNNSWNRQAAFPGCGEADIMRTAAAAAARFGGAWQTLDPLHCLADFCYAVRRETIAAIGGADEAYGAGPCWEMDYTARAARAGFRAVWAQGAFVYRLPLTRRRQVDEARLFEASRRRYQDKFCGLRFTGARTSYARHCRGDDCAHFAPAERIELHRPLGGEREPEPARQPAAAASLPARAVAAAEAAPLVSCIMPTRNRREWVLRSIAYFQRQTHANSELIIIDDGADLTADLPTDPRIRYIRPNRRLSIGAKRNLAVQSAQGDIIAHWDDDDWYAADRLEAQIAPLLADAADITALGEPRFFDVDRWEFWTCSPELYSRLFVHAVHGGTLAYRRHVIERLARYPDASLAEDAAFLNAAVARGARLQAIPADRLFLYLRHGGNAWSFNCGRYLDSRGWRRAEEPDWLDPDRGFYADRSAGVRPRSVPAAPTVRARTGDAPLVSCIMPTYNRRAFVPKAIEYFLRQDYPACELVVVDDGDDRVDDLVVGLPPQVRYVALPARLLLGQKRNTAVEAARGEIILHWDDDDWMDPGRVGAQVGALLDADADICGLSKVRFCDLASGRLSIYRYPPGQRAWLYGASLCYRRSLWRQKRFEPVDIGEDTRFVWATPTGRIVDLTEARLMVAMIHGGNTSRPQPFVGPNWHPCDAAAASEVLGADWPFYEELRRRIGAPLAA